MNASFDAKTLMSRQDDDSFDSSDLSFITKLAAIGDSYSAGIGAGGRLQGHSEDNEQSDEKCGRYDQAYPYLINNDDRLGDPTARTFQFQSCSGAVIADVVKKQLPLVDANQQVILLSADILNQCIYQWSVLSSEQVVVGKLEVAKLRLENSALYKYVKDFDFEKAALGCEGQLAASRQLIDSSKFSDDLDALLKATKLKLGSSGMIYYTGSVLRSLVYLDIQSVQHLPTRPETDGAILGTFKGDLSQFAEITLLLDPDAKFTNQDLIDSAAEEGSSAASLMSVASAIEVRNALPAGYGRVFHPQVLLH
ncbi:hypothetical protein BKA64DRAFT_712381 [Cadophora sp. MPI-SDFR-AT-0126]|nr:hypothetical protein BKA64DRAFT_712381 [Leotiomycetes sp. MPI-SDFR-AT-0126]